MRPDTLAPATLQKAAGAVAALLRFEHPADAVLRRFFREHPQLGRHDRAFVADAAFGVLRHLRLLEHFAQGRAPRRLLIAWLLRIQGLSLRGVDALLKTDEREPATAMKAAPMPAMPALRYSLPDWLDARLASAGIPDLDALRAAMLEPAPLDLRVNTLKARRDDVIATLRASDWVASPTPLAPTGVRVTGKPSLEKHALFTGGQIEVQDEGSQLVAFLTAPSRGQMVVDFCAGAGGKTLALGALMRSEGRLYAMDTSEKRLANLKPRLARSGLSNVQPMKLDSENDIRVKRLAGRIDRVLVDAPCSGTGTLRRNPDLKWRMDAQAVTELQAKQTAILAAAARLPRVGGRLVYATCSLLPDENEAVVERFLAADPRWR
ncbi:MAG: RsmB/NOP family class I SAM-dependent RNA methyltransferase, partial [Burkholderiales bacterium]|nr:RsmB/NOP family class I SAM-dependent RNA methyltransferase [Burkholderiales bacterium]